MHRVPDSFLSGAVTPPGSRRVGDPPGGRDDPRRAHSCRVRICPHLRQLQRAARPAAGARGDLGAAAGEPIVLVCRSGVRARQAEQVLSATGLPLLHVLDGGLAAWEAAGLPLTRGRQQWSLERQVRGVAGTLVLIGAIGGLAGFRPLGVLAAGVGGGLLFSAVTDTCGLAMVLTRLPYNRSASCDVGAAIRALGRGWQSGRHPCAAD